MKKIINGRLYNTDTAQEVGRDTNGLSRRDHAWWKETLYRKKTGEFFLFGEGGPASLYRQRYGDMWDSGEKIIPLSYESAQEWAEKHLSAEEYEEAYGEVSESSEKTVVSLYLSSDRAERYRRAASKQDVSLTAYIEALLDKAETM